MPSLLNPLVRGNAGVIPSSIILQGDWNANTNTPDITTTTQAGYAWHYRLGSRRFSY